MEQITSNSNTANQEEHIASSPTDDTSASDTPNEPTGTTTESELRDRAQKLVDKARVRGVSIDFEAVLPLVGSLSSKVGQVAKEMCLAARTGSDPHDWLKQKVSEDDFAEAQQEAERLVARYRRSLKQMQKNVDEVMRDEIAKRVLNPDDLRKVANELNVLADELEAK